MRTLLGDRKFQDAFDQLMAEGACELYYDMRVSLRMEHNLFERIAYEQEIELTRAAVEFLRNHPGIGVWDGNYRVNESIHEFDGFTLRAIIVIHRKEPDPT